MALTGARGVSRHHEVRTFHRQGDEWVDLYRHQYDPKLDRPTPHDPQLGDFRGHEVEDPDCWLGDCPQDVAFAVLGEMTFDTLTEDPLVVPTVMAVSESGVLWWIADWVWEGGRAVLACPWYRDFDVALAANPEGVFDCREYIDFGPDGTIDLVFIPDELNCVDLFDNDGDGLVDEADPDCPS